MALQIASFKITPVSVNLVTPFAISSSTNESADNVVLAIRDEQGLVGLGEAAPYTALTGDTQASALRMAQDVLTKVVGKNPAQALQMFYDQICLSYETVPSGLAAVELALLDLSARQKQMPLGRLWGRPTRDKIQTDITLPIMQCDRVRPFWQLHRDYDFAYVKIKIGNEPAKQSVERVMELHTAAPHMQISLDGNQGCTYDSAREIVRALAQHHVRPIFFEQPLPEDDWQGMAKLTADGEVKICADELVKTPADARRVVSEKAAHIINLKFVKSGLRNAIEIARIAIAHKLDLMIGGMLESEIMMTASLHAASVFPEIRYVDLDTPFFFAQRLTVDSPYHGKSAWLKVPTGNGLGLVTCLSS